MMQCMMQILVANVPPAGGLSWIHKTKISMMQQTIKVEKDHEYHQKRSKYYLNHTSDSLLSIVYHHIYCSDMWCSFLFNRYTLYTEIATDIYINNSILRYSMRKQDAKFRWAPKIPWQSHQTWSQFYRESVGDTKKIARVEKFAV